MKNWTRSSMKKNNKVEAITFFTEHQAKIREGPWTTKHFLEWFLWCELRDRVGVEWCRKRQSWTCKPRRHSTQPAVSQSENTNQISYKSSRGALLLFRSIFSATLFVVFFSKITWSFFYSNCKNVKTHRHNYIHSIIGKVAEQNTYQRIYKILKNTHK